MGGLAPRGSLSQERNSCPWPTHYTRYAPGMHRPPVTRAVRPVTHDTYVLLSSRCSEQRRGVSWSTTSSSHTFRGPPLCEAYEALWASSAHLSKGTPAGWWGGAGRQCSAWGWSSACSLSCLSDILHPAQGEGCSGDSPQTWAAGPRRCPAPAGLASSKAHHRRPAAQHIAGSG